MDTHIPLQIIIQNETPKSSYKNDKIDLHPFTQHCIVNLLVPQCVWQCHVSSEREKKEEITSPIAMMIR